jgi:GntR family transcriptional regulator/MocR family aminotransferase
MASSSRKTWTSWALDLHLDLRRAGGQRPRRALEASLREAIRGGRLPAGAGLPSSRALAADLGLARGTVVEVYAQLTAEGWLATHPGSRTVVGVAVEGSRPATVPAALVSHPPEFSLLPGDCDLATFPRAAWLGAQRRALASAPHASLGYGDVRGLAELRTELASYLARTRGVRADPERIVVTTGSTQSLYLTLRALAGTGRAGLAMEDPCLSLHRAVARAAGLRVRPVPVGAEGMRVSALARPSGREPAGAALVTPARQFPIGVSLSPRRRTELVAWARASDGYVVEDDYDGEFRYDRQPVGALQGLCPERIVYAGTTSKTLAPGVRLGWLVVPEPLLDAVVEAKYLADGRTSALSQLALTDLLGSGGYDRHVRRMRLHYRRRRDALLAALARSTPHRRVEGIAAGLSVAIELPAGTDEAALVAAAAARGLAITTTGTDGYYATSGPPYLIASYAPPPDHAFPAAVAALVDLLSGLPSGVDDRRRPTAGQDRTAVR